LASDIQQLVDNEDSEELHQLSYHVVDNAFNKLHFGANPRGINGATPCEVLHLIQLGWIKYAIEEFYNNVLTGEAKKFLDRITAAVSGAMQRQSDRDFPHLKFPCALSKYKQLHAHEYAGCLLILVIALNSHICWDGNREDRKSKGGTKNNFANNSSMKERTKRVQQFHHFFEMLLCFESWLKQEKFRKTIIQDGRATDAVKIAINKFVKVVNRQVGKKMELPKVHEPIHVPRLYVPDYGSPQNYSSGPLENGHIDWLKKTAKNTQKRKDKLDEQTAERQVELLLLRSADAIVNSKSDEERVPDRRTTRFSLTFH
jgi:hypothetical protein